MTGCKDSHPAVLTQSCSSLGGSRLSLHGTGFLNIQSLAIDISIGQIVTCDHVTVVNDWLIKCTIVIQSPLRIDKGQSYKIALETAR